MSAFYRIETGAGRGMRAYLSMMLAWKIGRLWAPHGHQLEIGKPLESE